MMTKKVKTIFQDGKTSLIEAIRNGHVATARLLLESKADINAASNEGSTALHYAAWRGLGAGVLLLLCGGAEVWRTDGAGETALTVAVAHGQWEAAKALLETPGAAEGIQVRGRDGWTCLHHALSLPTRGSSSSEWIRSAAALPSAARLLEVAERDVAAIVLDDKQLEVVNGADRGAQVRAGCVVKFWQFSSVLARSASRGGATGYYEVELLEMGQSTQFGFVCPDWEGGNSDKGVGDDSKSWAVDGHRQRKWHRVSAPVGTQFSAPFGSQWHTGDVVGLAYSISDNCGEGMMLVSVNGDFAPPNGLAFLFPSGLTGPLRPALSASSGLFRCNLSGPFRHGPPQPEFASTARPWVE